VSLSPVLSDAFAPGTGRSTPQNVLVKQCLLGEKGVEKMEVKRETNDATLTRGTGVCKPQEPRG